MTKTRNSCATVSTASRLFYAGKVIIFVLYVAATLYVTVLSRTVHSSSQMMPLFWSYRESFALEGNGLLQSLISGKIWITNRSLLREIILNILLYVPLGYLLPSVFMKLKKKRVIVLIGFFCSCATELVQYFFRLGWCDPDDVIGNTFGCLIGCLLYKLVLKQRLKYLQEDKTDNVPF